MRLSHLQCFWFCNFSKIWIPLIISKCNLKRRIRSAVLCSDFVYILLLTTYARLLCILLKSLSIVIFGFDDKFSQSSRFCWGSNFSLSLNLEPHSLIKYPISKTKLICPLIFQALLGIWVPLFVGGRLEDTLRAFCLRVQTGDYFKVSVGDNERNDHELGLVIKVNTA